MGKGIGTAIGHMLGDIRNFCPDDYAVFIAQIIEFLRLLVVRKAHRVGTNLSNKGHVLSVVLEG